VKIIAFDRFQPSVSMETIEPLLDDAQAYVADVPTIKAGDLEWSSVPLMAPLLLESQFDAEALARAPLAPDHRMVPR